MTTNDKAQRATVQIGPLSVDGFQMPDGSYRMSQTSAAGAVGIGRQNVSDFLHSKAIKALMDKGYTGQIFEIEVDSTEQRRGQTRINAVPLEVVVAYRKSRTRCIIDIENHPCPLLDIATAAVGSDKVVSFPPQGGDVH